MQYAMHESEDESGRLFDAARGCELFTQQLVSLSGERDPVDGDEVLYVLEGSAGAQIDGHDHKLAPGTAVFVARGTPWSVDGEVRAVSVVVHDPPPSDVSHAVLDLGAAERGSATAGREFQLGANPATGCTSVTQFVGLVPVGRAPDHFHTYDEVIYILEGRGELAIGGETAELRPGSCVHLPSRLVHCLANTGDSELRVLAVFRPAGSPAEAYYPDGTLAVVPQSDGKD